jgi:hypothetical protein
MENSTRKPITPISHSASAKFVPPTIFLLEEDVAVGFNEKYS